MEVYGIGKWALRKTKTLREGGQAVWFRSSLKEKNGDNPMQNIRNVKKYRCRCSNRTKPVGVFQQYNQGQSVWRCRRGVSKVGIVGDRGGCPLRGDGPKLGEPRPGWQQGMSELVWQIRSRTSSGRSQNGGD